MFLWTVSKIHHKINFTAQNGFDLCNFYRNLELGNFFITGDSIFCFSLLFLNNYVPLPYCENLRNFEQVKLAENQGPVVQSIASLKNSLMTNPLTVLANELPNILIFSCKNVSNCKSYSHFFSKKISMYLPYFNIETLTFLLPKNFVKFWTIGPCIKSIYHIYFSLFCLCWGFTAQSTQWGHVERGQFT